MPEKLKLTIKHQTTQACLDAQCQPTVYLHLEVLAPPFGLCIQMVPGGLRIESTDPEMGPYIVPIHTH